MHILVFFLQIWGILHYRGFMNPSIQGALQSLSIEGVLLWGLCEVPLYKGLCTHTHTHTHTFGFFLQIHWVLHYWGFAKPHYRRGFLKPLYRRGLAIGALQRLYKGLCKASRGFVCTYILVFFPYRYRGALLWRLCEAPLKNGFCYGGLTNPLYSRGFAVEGLQSHSIEGASQRPFYGGASHSWATICHKRHCL